MIRVCVSFSQHHGCDGFTNIAPSRRESYERPRRRADHRRRRLRRRGGLEPGRDAHAHPLPGAGRLDEPDRLPQQRPRLGSAPLWPTSPSTPTVRARADTTIPINDDDSPIKVANFNGVGGGTVLYAGALPALAPVRLPRAHARRRGGRLADRLLDARAVLRRERPHDGRRRPGRRSGLSAARSRRMPPVPLGRTGDDAGARLQQAGLALVALRQRDRHARVRRPRQVHQPRPLHAGLRAGRQGSADITYWPEAMRAGVELRTRCRVREITGGRQRHGHRRDLLRREGRRALPAAPRSWSSPATASARRACCSTPRRRDFPDGLANSLGPGRQEPDAAPLGRGRAAVFDEQLDGALRPAGVCIWSQQFYETDRVARLRARL